MSSEFERCLNELIEILAQVEVNKHLYDFLEARNKAAELPSKVEELRSAIEREGRAVLDAEEVREQVQSRKHVQVVSSVSAIGTVKTSGQKGAAV